MVHGQFSPNDTSSGLPPHCNQADKCDRWQCQWCQLGVELVWPRPSHEPACKVSMFCLEAPKTRSYHVNELQHVKGVTSALLLTFGNTHTKCDNVLSHSLPQENSNWTQLQRISQPFLGFWLWLAFGLVNKQHERIYPVSVSTSQDKATLLLVWRLKYSYSDRNPTAGKKCSCRGGKLCPQCYWEVSCTNQSSDDKEEHQPMLWLKFH